MSRGPTWQSIESPAASAPSGGGSRDDRRRDLDGRRDPRLDRAGARPGDRPPGRQALQQRAAAGARDPRVRRRHPRGRRSDSDEPGRRHGAGAHGPAHQRRAGPRGRVPRAGEGPPPVTLIALSTNETLWLITLGVGLVVALVVWALLEALRRTVNEVERAVSDVWTMGKRLAQNTATTHLLGTTKERGVELLEEVRQHSAPAE